MAPLGKKLRIVLYSVLLIGTLAGGCFAQEAAPPSSDMTNREYLEAQHKMDEESQHAVFVRSIILLAVVFGMLALYVLFLRSRQKKFLELAERQQKTLEEIRDLLKKT